MAMTGAKKKENNTLYFPSKYIDIKYLYVCGIIL